jgi:hypothetical protein
LRQATIVALLSLTAPLASAQGRNPAVRVTVQMAQGLEATKADVEDILRQQKPDSILGNAEAGPADIVLTLTRRYNYTGGSVTVAGAKSDTRDPTCIVEGSIDDRLVAHPELHRAYPVKGSGMIWRDAAAKLVDEIAEHTQPRLDELLRKRPDWPDIGFEFEPLTKERKKQFGAKDGEVVVTLPVQRPRSLRDGCSSGRRPRGQKNFRSDSRIGRSLMLA